MLFHAEIGGDGNAHIEALIYGAGISQGCARHIAVNNDIETSYFVECVAGVTVKSAYASKVPIDVPAVRAVCCEGDCVAILAHIRHQAIHVKARVAPTTSTGAASCLDNLR